MIFSGLLRSSEITMENDSSKLEFFNRPTCSLIYKCRSMIPTFQNIRMTGDESCKIWRKERSSGSAHSIEFSVEASGKPHTIDCLKVLKYQHFLMPNRPYNFSVAASPHTYPHHFPTSLIIPFSFYIDTFIITCDPKNTLQHQWKPRISPIFHFLTNFVGTTFENK